MGGDSGSCWGAAINYIGSGNIIITGVANSINFPVTSDGFDLSFNGNNDCFISKMNLYRSELSYSSFFGGAGYDRSTALFYESDNNIFLSGYTSSTIFPITSDTYDTAYSGGSNDCFISRLTIPETVIEPITPVHQIIFNFVRITRIHSIQ